MGAMTKLQAVNRILVAAGEYPVSSLVVTGANDITIAETILDEATTMIQMAGTNSNKIRLTLYPDSSGKISIDDDTIFIDTIGGSIGKNIAAKGRNPTYLIDLDNEGTDVFDSSTALEVEITKNYEFEDLETADQYYAVDMAARRYQFLVIGDKNTDAILNEQALFSRIAARAKNIRALDANFMDNSKSYWATIGGRRWVGPW